MAKMSICQFKLVLQANAYTVNTSEVIEKCFLDLRNMLLNQENIRNSSQNKKIYLAKKNFLVPSISQFILS